MKPCPVCKQQVDIEGKCANIQCTLHLCLVVAICPKCQGAGWYDKIGFGNEHSTPDCNECDGKGEL